MRVSVIGGSSFDDETAEVAREVGRLLGERGHTLVCGGLGGVMAAVCRGARKAEDGQHDVETIGILPTTRRADANEWVTTPIATGLGNARNPLVVLNGDAVIAIDGAAGTLSELGHALDHGRPVAGLDTHDVDLDGFRAVETPAEAVEYVESRAGDRG
ncbi:Rossmann fold nucleotide-binding protein [Halobacteriales archaeon QH_7_69_31]|nr:MAG: Rossmann fold nucleotide-binding protein [Halobacteriales archaeon QH_7_69_31]